MKKEFIFSPGKHNDFKRKTLYVFKVNNIHAEERDVCEKSLSYGVARGGKVALVVSDKKPLRLCARKDDDAMKQEREFRLVPI